MSKPWPIHEQIQVGPRGFKIHFVDSQYFDYFGGNYKAHNTNEWVCVDCIGWPKTFMLTETS